MFGQLSELERERAWESVCLFVCSLCDRDSVEMESGEWRGRGSLG